MLWPSPHCALEYQRIFVRDQFRFAGRELRRALRQRRRVALLSVHGQQDRLVPAAAMAAAERWIDGRHDLVSLAGVAHLPHEEAPAEVTEVLLTWLAGLRA
jgi:pimeloyl-ACP methyl ester carboxylesterase